jgi:hypothetical protein
MELALASSLSVTNNLAILERALDALAVMLDPARAGVRPGQTDRPAPGALPRTKVQDDLLARTKPRPTQRLLSRRQRRESVRGAYEIRAGVRVDKLRVLLVDDVLTTDATIEAYSRVLVDKDAAAVLDVTAARVVSGWTLLAPPQRRAIDQEEGNQQGAVSILDR